MIYTSRQEIYENEILPWIEKHKEDGMEIEYYGVRRVLTPKFPELPDGVVIEDFDDILDRLVKFNIKLKRCNETDDNTRYTRNTLTKSEVEFISFAMNKAFIFCDIPDRVVELYDKPKKTTHALTPSEEWVEVKTCWAKEDI